MKRIRYAALALGLVLSACYHSKQKGLTYFNDFESIKGWESVNLASGLVHSGKFSNKIDSAHPYGLTFSLPFKSITPLHLRKVKVNMWVYMTEGAKGIIAMDVKTADKTNIFWAGDEINKHTQPGIWQNVSVEFSLQNPSFNIPTNIISIYPWSRGNKEFYVDDVTIEFVQGL